MVYQANQIISVKDCPLDNWASEEPRDNFRVLNKKNGTSVLQREWIRKRCVDNVLTAEILWIDVPMVDE